MENAYDLSDIASLTKRLWELYPEEVREFKVPRSRDLISEVYCADIMVGEELKERYGLKTSEFSIFSFSKKEEYKIDLLNYDLINLTRERVCGTLLMIHHSQKREYALFLLDEMEKNAKLLIEAKFVKREGCYHLQDVSFAK